MSPRQRARAIVIASCCLVGIMSGTPNAFNSITSAIETDMGASPYYISALTGLGVSGIQFTLIGGLFLDKFGPAATVASAGALVALGYFLMSLTYSGGVVMTGYALVGFGSGATFISALGTVISMATPIGIGVRAARRRAARRALAATHGAPRAARVAQHVPVAHLHRAHDAPVRRHGLR